MTRTSPEKQSLIFAGGGTGGHLLPGIAVADQFASLGHFSITFIGSNRPVEQQIIERSGYRHLGLASSPSNDLKRAPWRFFWNNSRAFLRARQVLKKERPAAVIGLGGFASVPVILAAAWLRIPIVLLEQNIVPGRANRFLFSRATVVCIAFAETRLPQQRSAVPRVVFTGNPVRERIIQTAGSRQTESEETLLLILGGSQGAEAVNQAVLSLMEQDRQALPPQLHVVHQTGQSGWEQATQIYRRLQEADPDLKVTVEPFFDDLSLWYPRADLVISRAGATTLAELACIGCPTVLIPYPNSIGDHQLINARFYESEGAALLVEQTADSAGTLRLLQAAVVNLLNDSGKRQEMSEAMRRLALPEAANRVAQEILALIAD
ncbi:undecaprenyldiphospho-muramoylpentapeptide beta-N-acetylglucosaminyltransferase [Gimesia panareensis]|uniref:undecaprenyldiphospho-muramoylpentapeptide beta-N-acetylglucosaminyltransferase n=1 Tax=Gimesia panareensis TaxID=2527978 RepID=UPI00118AF260|nr:undecaprenyldiphospho-muramoylpentapeptide beta-N-acetylglucosaminyltransferase [Gimesia panareensis]QDU50045.1 UDP-N-acetylglucosamine--N-acetylmuramyl-(pentapeptide) pyrophosphoryl-undecaprenol N-acetylglucosamine transferase MurG [Gimesia panareensis]